MIIEFIVFVVLLSTFAGASWLRRVWFRRKDRIRARWVVRSLEEIKGQPMTEVLSRFGSPFEIVKGTGRSFYVWKSPPSLRFPAGSGLLIVNVVADAAGQVAQSSWQTR